MLITLNKHRMSLLGFTLMSVLLLACEGQLPQAYQKEDFDMTALDSRAIRLLSDSTVKSISAVSLAQPVSQLNIDSLFSMGLFDTLVTDSTLLINYPQSADTSYACYVQVSTSGSIISYVTWDLTENNRNAYIDIDLFQKDGTFVTNKIPVMPLETMAGYTDTVRTTSGVDLILPKIRSRIVFQLANELYIARFVISESTVIGSFRLVILRVQGK